MSTGSLISGIALYAKRLNPNIRIYACVREGNALAEHIRDGKRPVPDEQQQQPLAGKDPGTANTLLLLSLLKYQVQNPSWHHSFFSACCSQQCGMLTFPIMCSLVERQVFTVSERATVDATRFAFEELKLVIELAAGLSLGAIMSQCHTLDAAVRNVAVILTGGNIDSAVPLPWQQRDY